MDEHNSLLYKNKKIVKKLAHLATGINTLFH
jgi:hypothetical protein